MIKITTIQGRGVLMPSVSSHGIVQAVPPVGLAIALLVLVVVPMPAGNAEVVKLIAAGFLGALTQGRISGAPQ